MVHQLMSQGKHRPFEERPDSHMLPEVSLAASSLVMQTTAS
jgi:hypothetical protein